MRRRWTDSLRQRSTDWCIAALLLIAVSESHAQSLPTPLTSPAIDPTIYRDGEVRRFSSQHGVWGVVCDEVTRLKQRFCSLRTILAGAEGTVVADVTISTGQDGRPAGLLRIAAPLVRGGNLEITTQPASSKPELAAKGKSMPVPSSPAKTTLKPVNCDERACTVIWTLRAEQIAALNDGRSLSLLAVAGVDFETLANFTAIKPRTVALRLTGVGFKDAVAVSLRPFE